MRGIITKRKTYDDGQSNNITAVVAIENLLLFIYHRMNYTITFWGIVIDEFSRDVRVPHIMFVLISKPFIFYSISIKSFRRVYEQRLNVKQYT